MNIKKKENQGEITKRMPKETETKGSNLMGKGKGKGGAVEPEEAPRHRKQEI